MLARLHQVSFPLSAKCKMKMDEIEIKFTPQERDLIIDHTFTGPDLTKRLQIAEIKGKHLYSRRGESYR
jgi:hypothetical protein